MVGAQVFLGIILTNCQSSKQKAGQKVSTRLNVFIRSWLTENGAR